MMTDFLLIRGGVCNLNSRVKSMKKRETGD